MEWRSLKRAAALLFFCGILCVSCMEPGPLYGTWADNQGNTISFFYDDTFSAKINAAPGSVSQNYEGNYAILLNSLTLDCAESGQRIVTEWDIRGNNLYMDWTNSGGESIALTLFKISN